MILYSTSPKSKAHTQITPTYGTRPCPFDYTCTYTHRRMFADVNYFRQIPLNPSSGWSSHAAPGYPLINGTVLGNSLWRYFSGETNEKYYMYVKSVCMRVFVCVVFVCNINRACNAKISRAPEIENGVFHIIFGEICNCGRVVIGSFG